MNKAIIMGRLTKDPDIRYGQDNMQIARYTVAVDRMKKDAGADFISCVAFGKSAEFADKFLAKGTKVVIVGRIQTGSYKNKDGQTVYTNDVIVESSEFAESKKATPAATDGFAPEDSGWMDVPADMDSEELPWN